MSIVEKSYDLHKKHYKVDHNFNLDQYIQMDTVDSWRHWRFFHGIEKVVHLFKKDSWLTVGDGRYGLDSLRLNKMGVENITASDISETLLKRSKELKFLNDYRVENVEKLNCEDESFDVLFCKEAFHHFPRPYIGLYEMLRVAKKAVVLIEPADRRDFRNLITLSTFHLKRIVYRIIRRRPMPEHLFETVGNYLYSVSIKEMIKISTSLGFDSVAYKFINDHYIKGAEQEALAEKGPIFKKINAKIKMRDLFAKLNLWQPGIIEVIILKKDIGEKAKMDLIHAGFKIKTLDRNPYL